jgi:ethanolamine-phosphate cytidylyltransferase
MAAASPSFSMSGVSGMNADFLYPFLDVHAVFNTVVGSELISQLVALLHLVLAAGRVPPPYPNAEQVVLWVSATALTLVSYYFLFGMRHRGRRMWLQKELRSAQERVSELEEKLVEADVLGQGDLKGKEVRIWMDGAFDMMHYGHMNAFRQGKALGTKLIVGVNSDKSITECKGAPVMKDDERLEAVRGCKFVDEVVPEVPYIMNEEYLEHVIRKYK